MPPTYGNLRSIKQITLLAAFLICCGSANGQKLTVTAVTHKTQEFDFQSTSPQNSQTNCTVNDPSVNCHTTTSGGETQTRAVYRLDQEVTANGLRYKRTRTARWVWSSADFLTDGETFQAEIKGNHMFITCRRGGNQGKKETIKYQILDIRPIQPLPAAPPA